MGTGSGVGLGTGKGMKGGWLVNTFLLLLTGWQAVLHPWLPLILKDAGFSSTSVGVLSGGMTLAASLGVVASLWGMRRSRSGAVRRLLLWLLLAAATLLQGCGVVLLLQQMSQGGALQSCVAGWPFAPATSALPLNMSVPTTPLPQGPHPFAPQTAPITTTTTTTTTTTPITTFTTVIPALVPTVPTSTTTTTTTTPSVIIPDTVPVTTTTVPSQITVPAELTTHEPRGTELVTSRVVTVQTLTTGLQEGSEKGRPDGDFSQDIGEYDNRNEDEDEDNEADYEDAPKKDLNDYPRVGGHSRVKVPLSIEGTLQGVARTMKFSGVPSRHLQHDVQAGYAKVSRGPYTRRIKTENENSLQDFRNTTLFLSKERKQNKLSASFLNDQGNLPSLSSPHLRLHHRLQPLVTKVQPQHQPPWPLHHSSAESVKDLSNGNWQYGDQDGQVRTGSERIRRGILHTDSRGNALLDDPGTKETVSRLNNRTVVNRDPPETLENEGVKAGVAVLLALGGLLGAGMEAGVAQLWHCYTHGYDEEGVSQDVLQRTITHTFHLSTYGNHKSWTGITSGGLAMVAGIVSILTCLAGAGGSGYGGLLGVHITLGLGALLVLLVLPVPYGSIDPPRTRRPLSLYLDDEVLREGVRRLTFHLWVFVNGCLTALSLTFSLWLLKEITVEGWLVGSQAVAVGVTLMCESLALQTQRRLVALWGLHGVMGVCGVSLMLHYGIMWASSSVGMVVAAHAGLGVAMAFLWVAVKHNALLLATVSDQEREAWVSWWCWRFGVGVGAAVWSVGVSEAGNRVQPLLLLATLIAATLASFLCVAALFFRRHSRARRRVYHTLDLDIANEDDEAEEDDDAEDDWLVKRAKKEGLAL